MPNRFDSSVPPPMPSSSVKTVMARPSIIHQTRRNSLSTGVANSASGAMPIFLIRRVKGLKSEGLIQMDTTRAWTVWVAMIRIGHPDPSRRSR